MEIVLGGDLLYWSATSNYVIFLAYICFPAYHTCRLYAEYSCAYLCHVSKGKLQANMNIVSEEWKQSRPK